MEDKNFDVLNDLLEKGDYYNLREELSEMNEADIAEYIENLEEEKMILVFRLLQKDISAEVFAYLSNEFQSIIVNAITDKELSKLMNDSFTDDVVDFLEEVPASVVNRVMMNMSREDRNVVNTFLQYPENSAGSIMTSEMIELHDRLTVAEAIAKIRSIGIDKETIYSCYVIDNGRHLIGAINLSDLIFHADSTYIRDIMDEKNQIVSVHTLQDQEEVVSLTKKYDLISIPVVDNEDRLVGIITIDDIVDVIEEEATEDFSKMAAITPTLKPYLKTSVFENVKSRIGWLLILMISATLTGTIINSFEGMLAAITGLTACIPILTGTGGNAGNQSSTVAIRGLALGEISVNDYFKVLFKELQISIICGIILGSVNFLRMIVFHTTGTIYVYLVVSISMCFAVVVAKSIGCTLPIIAKLCKIDPAVMASAVISTIVDSLSLLIYFGLTYVILM